MLPDEKSPRRVQITVLVTLFILFLIGIYRCETIEQQADTRDQPSSLADTRPGAGALYDLLQTMGYPVNRMVSAWNQLDTTSAVLVVLEPFSRNPIESENKPLRRWIERGGTLLFVCTGEPQPLDPNDTVAGDVSLVSVQKTMSHPAPANTDLQYTRGITTICVSSPLRIVLSNPDRYQVLFRDNQGIVAVHKRMGLGHVVLMANDLIATNQGIAQDDNSLFLVNVAAAGTAPTRLHGGFAGKVAFDEYHHGVGFEAETPGSIGVLLHYIPGPMRWTLLDLLGFVLIVVYIGNVRRAPLSLIFDNRARPPGDYVRSMARLYRRTRSTDLVIQAIYLRLLRDLRSQLNLSPDVLPMQIVALLTEASAADKSRLVSIIDRCERSVAGSRISENELVALAASIELFRKDCAIVGYH